MNAVLNAIPSTSALAHAACTGSTKNGCFAVAVENGIGGTVDGVGTFVYAESSRLSPSGVRYSRL